MLHKILVPLFMLALVCTGTAIAGDPLTPGTGGPVLRVLTPAPGAILMEGSDQAVTWAMEPPQAADSVRITLSGPATKGVVLATLVKDIPDKWEWMVVKPIGQKLKLEVIAYLPDRVTVKGSSTISIVSQPEATVPEPNYRLTVKSPNGGEKLMVGMKKSVRWAIKFPETVRPADMTFAVNLSRDGGLTYPESLANGLKSTTTEYTWTVTKPAAEKCRLKVTLMDVAGKEIQFDASDADFLIISDTAQPHNEGTGE